MSTESYKRQTLTQKNMDLMQEVEALILKRTTLEDQLKEVMRKPRAPRRRHLIKSGKAIVSQVENNLKSLKGSSKRAREIKILKRQVAVQTSICEKLETTFNRGMRKLPICTICMTETKDGDLLLLKCGHAYDYKCLVKWLEENTKCPNCQTKILRGELRVARVNRE